MCKRWIQKISAIVIIALLISCKAFCENKVIEERGGFETMDVTEYIEMMETDVPNDHMSLFWDGTNMTTVEDKLDDESLMDGRGGEYLVSRFKASVGRILSVDDESLLSEENIIQNYETCFEAESEHRFVRIYRSGEEYSRMEEQCKADMDAKKLAAHSLELKVEGICVKTILQAPSERMMAGFRIIVPDEENNATVYEYGGIGNFSDITVEASMFANLTIK